MACVKQLKTKKCPVYKVTVSNGYDLHGKKIVKPQHINPIPHLLPNNKKKLWISL